MTTKAEFVAFYSEKNNIKNFTAAEEKIDKFIEAMKKALLENDEIVFKKFGTFQVKKTNEREICDPKGSGKKIQAKSKKYIKFTVSRTLGECLCYKNLDKEQM